MLERASSIGQVQPCTKPRLLGKAQVVQRSLAATKRDLTSYRVLYRSVKILSARIKINSIFLNRETTLLRQMPLLDLYHAVRDHSRDHRNALQGNHAKLSHRLLDVFLRTWDLGFTAFGGPPVHFQIIHRRFVSGKSGKAPWIDEQMVCRHVMCHDWRHETMI